MGFTRIRACARQSWVWASFQYSPWPRALSSIKTKDLLQLFFHRLSRERQQKIVISKNGLRTPHSRRLYLKKWIAQSTQQKIVFQKMDCSLHTAEGKMCSRVTLMSSSYIKCFFGAELYSWTDTCYPNCQCAVIPVCCRRRRRYIQKLSHVHVVQVKYTSLELMQVKAWL
jgi:hypothetical protein